MFEDSKLYLKRDAELLTTYGWIECVGHANRSCYDLSVHAAAAKTNMHYFKKFEETQVRDVAVAKPNKVPCSLCCCFCICGWLNVWKIKKRKKLFFSSLTKGIDWWIVQTGSKRHFGSFS